MKILLAHFSSLAGQPAATVLVLAVSGLGSGRGLGTTTYEYDVPQHLLPPSGYAFTAIDADANGSFADAILTAVPEPATWLGGALSAGVALAGSAWRARQHLLCRLP